MKRCSVRPYEGADNYIFVSYCHRDKQEVYPIIERLARDGYRVWYDEGIDPGADWPEVIADHLSRCALCIAFLSDNALNSQLQARNQLYPSQKKTADIRSDRDRRDVTRYADAAVVCPVDRKGRYVG